MKTLAESQKPNNKEAEELGDAAEVRDGLDLGADEEQVLGQVHQATPRTDVAVSMLLTAGRAWSGAWSVF